MVLVDEVPDDEEDTPARVKLAPHRLCGGL